MRSNNYMDTEEHLYTDELNETDDQTDNLLKELNELVAQSGPTL